MILQDILYLIPDNQTVVVTDWKNNEIARYDGMDSIPNNLNPMRVEKITSNNDTLYISILMFPQKTISI